MLNQKENENNEKLKKQVSVNLFKALDTISLVEDNVAIKLEETLKMINLTDSQKKFLK